MSLFRASRLSLACRRVASQARRFPTTATALGFSSTRIASKLQQRPLERHTSTLSESFLNGSNGHYVDAMYVRWRRDPSSVHASWDVYFQTGNYQAPPSEALTGDYTGQAMPSVSSGADAGSVDPRSLEVTQKVQQMIRAFQVRGHFMANLDPLGLVEKRRGYKNPQELTLEYWGFTEEDLKRQVNIGQNNLKGFLDSDGPQMTLGAIYKRLKDAYSGSIGIEYMHIPDTEQCNWIREKFETPEKYKVSKEEREHNLKRLCWADHFEQFLAKKFGTAKRFGLEGAESTIPGMKALIHEAANEGVESIVLGMPHRGRLNVLSTVVRKPMEQIFTEFAGGESGEVEGTGDVKYHLGMSHSREINGKPMKLSLVANPSHLEAVNPVVAGKTRAKQFYANDTDRSKNMAVVLHGDAAFSGQGVVYETLGLGDLPDYTTGGTIHIVVNNQIGFTTDPTVARSAPYCTEVAKAVGAPIFHVNGDDVEAVVRTHKLAMQWRQRFKKDVVIDLWCYRRHGHNELDEPMFTQPRMYTKIKEHPSTLAIYQKQLIESGQFTAAEVQATSDEVNKSLEDAYNRAQDVEFNMNQWLEDNWKHMVPSATYVPPSDTSVPIDTLQEIGNKLVTLPDGFPIHSRLKMVMKQKEAMVKNGADIDWATGEALAFGSLLLDGHHVRLSGQDVERGTFSHRHAVLHSQNGDGSYRPLEHLGEKQAKFSVSNSHLSEYGVLGFELGFSYENPNSLVIWEAQFGDFFNGAQIIVDQFLSSGEQKWQRMSGLVMLLPHGYEGQGPEHSSARLERFLQSSSDDPSVYPDMNPGTTTQHQECNWTVCNFTTPANYFHALRRQIKNKYRKPLIVMAPKSLLRHKSARSTYADMAEGSQFARVIPEVSTDLVKPNKVRRVIFCSGKVYYDLAHRREEKGVNDVAIVRVEQISPFPFDLVEAECAKYKNAEVVWVQEEHKNMGAWSYVEPRIETATRGKKRAKYVGRGPSASTATGRHSQHDRELESFLTAAFK